MKKTSELDIAWEAGFREGAKAAVELLKKESLFMVDKVGVQIPDFESFKRATEVVPPKNEKRRPR